MRHLKPFNESSEEVLFSKIMGAIKDEVNTHGPITKSLITSVAKRIFGNIKGDIIEYQKNKMSHDEDFIVITKLKYNQMKKELHDKSDQIKNLSNKLKSGDKV